MRKKIALLLISILFISGCSISKVDISNYDYLINNIIIKNKSTRNESFDGFSIYIPRGMRIVSKDEYNLILSDKNNNYYYVFIDVVSYYNKVKNTYKVSNDAYYSKKIKNSSGKKTGYLEINEIKNKYFVEALYNYVKIEVYSSKEYMDDAVVNISEILSSVKYNDKVLSTIIGDKKLNYKEESFNIFTSKKNTTNYLDYIKKYDSGATKDYNVKNNTSDEDIIDIEIDED